MEYSTLEVKEICHVRFPWKQKNSLSLLL